MSHQYAIAGRVQPRLLGLSLGTVGGLIFFVISGYLVTASWPMARVRGAAGVAHAIDDDPASLPGR